MKKKTLIFDASIISDNLSNFGSGRSGVYFAAYNILKNLIKTKQFNVFLYANNPDCEGFCVFVEQNFGKGIKIYYGNKYATLLRKFALIDKKLRENKHNIAKLFLNIFVRKPLNFFGSFVKIPKFDVAVSPIYVFNKKIHALEKYIILYDAIPVLFSDYYKTPRSNRHYWFNVLVKYIKTDKTCKYFAISESTKKDFVRLLNMNPDDIVVMPLAANDKFYPEKDDGKIKKICEKYNIPTDKKYVFSLCTLEPRKNLIRAVKTFIEFIKKNNIDDMVFVLGGAHWDKFIGKLESEIRDLGKYKDKIIRAGYIMDEDLAALYSGAQWFIYTSQYEGFGMPPLEAMKCGCPVITSNNSSLPEVVGDAGIMIDWDSDEQHIAAYEKYYTDEKYRKEMANKGLERAKMFSWEKTVDIIIKEINKG